MTKSELIERLVSKYPDLPAADVELVVKTLFEHMISTLEKDELIEIHGFGGFSIRHMSARRGRNPKTGEAIQVLPRSMVHFKPGLEMRERVNNFKHQISPL